MLRKRANILHACRVSTSFGTILVKIKESDPILQDFASSDTLITARILRIL